MAKSIQQQFPASGLVFGRRIVVPQSGAVCAGFTLAELMVSALVLTIIILLVGQLFSSTVLITGMKNKQIDADSQARAVFDRMAIDFGQMVRRSDVDFYLKDPANSQKGSGGGKNDQIAFYCQVPGYSPSGGSRRPVSVVGYRVNSNSSSAAYHKLQRFGYGLVWNNTSGNANSLVAFSSNSTSSGTSVISQYWPAAIDSDVDDTSYELAGPQVFRMEYFYILKGQTLPSGTQLPSILSNTPWDTRNPGPNHTSVDGLADVVAIAVVIAVIDPKSRVLVTNTQLELLAREMNDFATTKEDGTATQPGDLEAQWKNAIEQSHSGISRVAASTIRVYQRRFFLPANSTPAP